MPSIPPPPHHQTILEFARTVRSMPGPKHIWPGCSLLPGKLAEIPYGCNPPQGPTSYQLAAYCPQQQRYSVTRLLYDLFQELVWSERGWTPHLPSGCQSPRWWRIPLPKSPQLSKKGTERAHCKESGLQDGSQHLPPHSANMLFSIILQLRYWSRFLRRI